MDNSFKRGQAVSEKLLQRLTQKVFTRLVGGQGVSVQLLNNNIIVSSTLKRRVPDINFFHTLPIISNRGTDEFLCFNTSAISANPNLSRIQYVDTDANQVSKWGIIDTTNGRWQPVAWSLNNGDVWCAIFKDYTEYGSYHGYATMMLRRYTHDGVQADFERTYTLTGGFLWYEFPFGSTSFRRFHANDNLLFAFAETSTLSIRIYAFNPITGDIQWTYDAPLPVSIVQAPKIVGTLPNGALVIKYYSTNTLPRDIRFVCVLDGAETCNVEPYPKPPWPSSDQDFKIFLSISENKILLCQHTLDNFVTYNHTGSIVSSASGTGYTANYDEDGTINQTVDNFVVGEEIGASSGQAVIDIRDCSFQYFNIGSLICSFVTSNRIWSVAGTYPDIGINIKTYTHTGSLVAEWLFVKGVGVSVSIVYGKHNYIALTTNVSASPSYTYIYNDLGEEQGHIRMQ